MEITVWINARFLARPITGVERVARELLSALAQRLDDRGGWTAPDGRQLRFRLIAPASSTTESPWSNLALHRAGSGDGHRWEQTGLLAATRGDWLISLCNTGPIFKRRHVLFLHDAMPFAIPSTFTWKFRLWYKVLFHIGGRMARALLTNSNFSRDELVRCVGLSKSHITPMTLGTEHVLRLPPDTQILEKHGLTSTPYLLAVSSVKPNKNFAAVVRALELLGDQSPVCVIAGQRYDKVFNKTTLADGRRTVHVGYVSDAELYALYSKAQCLLFPSFYEGFGLPPLEAMALGCPAIVSHTSAMPESCGDAALYCDPTKPETLADGIRRLQNEPGLRDQLVARGLNRAQMFSWSLSTEILLNTLINSMGKNL